MVTSARIVFVNSRNHLTDSTGHDCRYRTADGESLCPGYWYVVSWPDDVDEPLFDAQAHYAGPHASQKLAKDELQRITSASGSTPSPASDPAASSLGDVAYFPDWHCGP